MVGVAPGAVGVVGYSALPVRFALPNVVQSTGES